MKVRGPLTVAVILAALVARGVAADEIRVAVATNFAEPMSALVAQFSETSGHTVLVSSGSTGGHYAQIKNGAPFEAFFAADVERPTLLEQEGIAVRGSRFLYAVGRLALWSPRPGFVDDEGRVLETGDFRFLAIANPELAPYGAAAREVLMARNVWSKLQGRLVQGQDIGQAYSFVFTGNAELGFVAYSQIKKPGGAEHGLLLARAGVLASADRAGSRAVTRRARRARVHGVRQEPGGARDHSALRLRSVAAPASLFFF